MAPILKIDSFDLSSYIRLGPGEGFDPADSDFLEPQYGDSAIGAGDPLISIRERNREMAWPIHMTPRKSGGAFASTKDGLHQMVQALNRACRSARVIEWREDGATNSTFLDAAFCRFDVDYNYRRAAHLFCSGVLRVVTRPFGHTGTWRLATTTNFAGSAAHVRINVPSFGGDTAVLLRTYAGGASVLPAGSTIDINRMAAFAAVVPTSVVAFWPAASLSSAGGTLIGDANAPGSRAHRTFTTGGIGAPGAANSFVIQSSGTPRYGYARQRLLAVLRLSTAEQASRVLRTAVNDVGTTISPIPSAAEFSPTGWFLLDAGVIQGLRTYNNPNADQIKLGFDLSLPSGAASRTIDCGGLFVLPEDRTVYAHGLPSYGAQVAPMSFAGFNGASSVYSEDTGGDALNVVSDLRGRIPGLTPAASPAEQVILGVAPRFEGRWGGRVDGNIYLRERFAFHR